MITRVTRPIVALTVSMLALTACAGDDAAGPHLALDAELPSDVPDGTTLTIGDPQTQVAMELSGEAEKLSFDVEWANISGGPQTTEAFRGDALDIGAVADIPPIHATWTGLDVRIVSARYRVDPIEHPTYELGTAPEADIEELEDLEGKKIAYSPGQAQGALILRILDKAGLTQDDVDLVELPSTGDTYPNALSSGEVDAAPLAGTVLRHYLSQYESDGASALRHGLRDDPWHLYVRTETLEDANKAAAIAEYVEAWGRATEWVDQNPEEWIEGYYVQDQGLTTEDGQYLVDQAGEPDIPADWDDPIARHQETIDLLAEATDEETFDAAELYDRRFEKLAADAIAKEG